MHPQSQALRLQALAHVHGRWLAGVHLLLQFAGHISPQQALRLGVAEICRSPGITESRRGLPAAAAGHLLRLRHACLQAKTLLMISVAWLAFELSSVQHCHLR